LTFSENYSIEALFERSSLNHFTEPLDSGKDESIDLAASAFFYSFRLPKIMLCPSPNRALAVYKPIPVFPPVTTIFFLRSIFKIKKYAV
jgi:hypothetical protein